MRKIVFFLVGVFACVGTISAQDYSWMENSPENYLPKMTQIIISANSPCNQDGEAFKDFIPRFRTDKAFRNSRLKFSDEMYESSFQSIAYSDTGYGIFKAVKKNTKCDKSYGTWYNVSANEVCFTYSDVLPCDEFGGSSVTARFQRIDGKWYCTACMVAG